MNEEEEFLENKGLIGLAIKKLHIHWKTQDEFQDYEDAGIDGLLSGIRTYEKEKGYKKSTYYYSCIKNEICKSMYLKSCKKRKGDVVSLNTVINEGIELGELIPSEDNIEEKTIKKARKKELLRLVNNLPIEKDKLIIKNLFGLDGYKEISAEKLAKKLGISKTAIYDKKRRALVQLWLMIRKNEERDELFQE